MIRSFVFSRVGVLVRHWFEIDLDDGSMEHGARLELRLLEPEPHRGTESAAQRFVLDRPVWRADLFDRLGDPAGTFSVAHFHPHFDGNEPSERAWSPEIKADPWSWAQRQLSDIGRLCVTSSVGVEDLADDVDDLRQEAEAIVRAAESFGPARCTSVGQCHRWTRDVTESVRLMTSNMRNPELLDKDYARPWLTG
jgi:hypothetical protein